MNIQFCIINFLLLLAMPFYSGVYNNDKNNYSTQQIVHQLNDIYLFEMSLDKVEKVNNNQLSYSCKYFKISDLTNEDVAYALKRQFSCSKTNKTDICVLGNCLIFGSLLDVKLADFDHMTSKCNLEVDENSSEYNNSILSSDLCLSRILHPQFFIKKSNQFLTVNELIVAVCTLCKLLVQTEHTIYINDFYIQQLDILWNNIYESYTSIYRIGPNYNAISNINYSNVTKLLQLTGNKLIGLHDKIYFTDYYNSGRNIKLSAKHSSRTNFKRNDVLVVN